MKSSGSTALIRKFKDKILSFGKVIQPKAFWAPFSYVHAEIENLLVSDKKRLNIILPRGLAKTTLVSVIYTLYHLFVEEVDGNKCVILVSKTRDHAINCLTTIKNILEYSYPFRDICGYHGESTSKKWSEDMIILDNGLTIIAKGMGQPIRGVNIDFTRPSLLILDDPEDENNTKTAEAMAANLTWLLKGAIPAIDVRYGKCVVIGTPLHQLCIVEQLANADGWNTTRYPYLIGPTGEADLNGESIWPEVMSKEKLLKEYNDLLSMGRSSAFFSERMCSIIGDEMQLIKPSYIRYWEGSLINTNGGRFIKINEIDGETKNITVPVNVFIGVDPASSVNINADYSVIMVVAYTKDKERYVLGYMRERLTPMKLAQKIIEYGNLYKPDKMRIEGVGYQDMLRDYIRSTGIYFPGLEIKELPRGSKSSRLETLEPQFASGKVFLKASMQDFITELITYPRAKHDDTLDAYYYAQKNNFVPSHGEEAIIKERKTSRGEIMVDTPYADNNDWLIA